MTTTGLATLGPGNIQRNPRVSPAAQDPDNPYRYVWRRPGTVRVTVKGMG